MKRTKKQRRIDSNSAKKAWEIRRKNKTDKVGTQGVKKSWITRRKNGNDRISEETKNKIRNALIFGQKSRVGKTYEEIYGKDNAEKIKKKMKNSAFERFVENNYIPRIGKHETELLDKQEKIDNCKIERQYRIPTMRYIVDGYCPETNTVYEVYENKHLNHIQEDLRRQKEITNILNCNFVIIKDNK